MWPSFLWLLLTSSQPSTSPAETLQTVREVPDQQCTIYVNGQEIEGDCRFEVREHSLALNRIVLRRADPSTATKATVASNSLDARVAEAERQGLIQGLSFDQRLQLVCEVFRADPKIEAATVAAGAILVKERGNTIPYYYELSSCPPENPVGAFAAELEAIVSVVQRGGIVLMSDGVFPFYVSWKWAPKAREFIEAFRRGQSVDPAALRACSLERLLDFAPDLKQPRPLTRLEVE